jgi:hypothetical protein
MMLLFPSLSNRPEPETQVQIRYTFQFCQYMGCPGLLIAPPEKDAALIHITKKAHDFS